MREPLRYDHYRVLGIARDASSQEVKRAYRERVKVCHPDRNEEPGARNLFHVVHSAYETLRDPERRRAYDADLRFYRAAGAPAGPTRPTTRRSTDRPVNRFAFIGLHVTGLCFGVTLVTGLLLGVFFFEWPVYVLVFTLPGLVVIPDSLGGLRAK